MKGALSRPVGTAAGNAVHSRVSALRVNARLHCWCDLRGDLMHCWCDLLGDSMRGWGSYVGPSQRGGRIGARWLAPISPSTRRDGGEAFLGREEKLRHFAIVPGALHLVCSGSPKPWPAYSASRS